MLSVLAISFGANLMYFQRAESLETSLQTLSQQVEDLSASVTQVRQTTMVYAITVSYTPFQEAQSPETS